VLRVPFAVGAAGEDRIEKFGGGRERLIEVWLDFHLRRQSAIGLSPVGRWWRQARGERLLFALLERELESVPERCGVEPLRSGDEEDVDEILWSGALAARRAVDPRVGVDLLGDVLRKRQSR
jgi:hypothetical protein